MFTSEIFLFFIWKLRKFSVSFTSNVSYQIVYEIRQPNKRNDFLVTQRRKKQITTLCVICFASWTLELRVLSICVRINVCGFINSLVGYRCVQLVAEYSFSILIFCSCARIPQSYRTKVNIFWQKELIDIQIFIIGNSIGISIIISPIPQFYILSINL